MGGGGGGEGFWGDEAEGGKRTESAGQQRQGARSGAQRAANPRNQSDPDKHIKAHKIAGAQSTGAKAARTDKAIGRLDSGAPDEVREPWQLRLEIAESKRAGAVAVALTRAIISRG